MWRSRSNLRVAAGGEESERGKLRIVEAVNDVVRHARMLGLIRQHAVEDLRCLFLFGVGLVTRRRGAEERESVEDGCLVVLGVRRRQFFHRRFIAQRSRRVRRLVRVGVERVDGVDVSALAVGLRPRFFGLRRRFGAVLQLIGRRRLPHRMVVGHGHAPPGDAAGGIRAGRGAE